MASMDYKMAFKDKKIKYAFHTPNVLPRFNKTEWCSIYYSIQYYSIFILYINIFVYKYKTVIIDEKGDSQIISVE